MKRKTAATSAAVAEPKRAKRPRFAASAANSIHIRSAAAAAADAAATYNSNQIRSAATLNAVPFAPHPSIVRSVAPSIIDNKTINVLPAAADILPAAAEILPAAADILPAAAEILPAAADILPAAAPSTTAQWLAGAAELGVGSPNVVPSSSCLVLSIDVGIFISAFVLARIEERRLVALHGLVFEYHQPTLPELDTLSLAELLAPRPSRNPPPPPKRAFKSATKANIAKVPSRRKPPPRVTPQNKNRWLLNTLPFTTQFRAFLAARLAPLLRSGDRFLVVIENQVVHQFAANPLLDYMNAIVVTLLCTFEAQIQGMLRMLPRRKFVFSPAAFFAEPKHAATVATYLTSLAGGTADAKFSAEASATPSLALTHAQRKRLAVAVFDLFLADVKLQQERHNSSDASSAEAAPRLLITATPSTTIVLSPAASAPTRLHDLSDAFLQIFALLECLFSPL